MIMKITNKANKDLIHCHYGINNTLANYTFNVQFQIIFQVYRNENVRPFILLLKAVIVEPKKAKGLSKM